MVDLVGKKYGENICGPGLSRRDVLRIGSIGAGGLALPELLRAEKLQKTGSSNKSVIMVYMAGAPPHQDLIDPKPDAPKEVRSAFGPIRTNVTGIHVNESLPMLAKVMNKWTGIRTMVGAPSGIMIPSCAIRASRIRLFDRPYPKPPGNWPSMGSSLSQVGGLPQEGHASFRWPCSQGRSSALRFARRAWFSGNGSWSFSSDREVFVRHEAGLRFGSHRPEAIPFGRLRFLPQILERRERP